MQWTLLGATLAAAAAAAQAQPTQVGLWGGASPASAQSLQASCANTLNCYTINTDPQRITEREHLLDFKASGNAAGLTGTSGWWATTDPCGIPAAPMAGGPSGSSMGNDPWAGS